MKESPILFSTEMVQAILDGRKTMTRRKNIHNTINETVDQWLCNGLENEDGYFTFGSESLHTDIDIICPYGHTGDILWVRETFGYSRDGKLHFKSNVCSPEFDKPAQGWKPSIHMPKAAARIWLQITEIRVERLRDVTEEDAIAEGIKKTYPDLGFDCYLCRQKGHNSFNNICNDGGYNSAILSFKSLWSSINGEESFDANPWVWVISFKVLSTTGKPSEL